MRLVCPNCEAKYEVPEDAIPETGRDVQCANCGHAWFQMRPRAAAAETVVAPPAPVAATAPVAPSVVEPAPVAEPVAEAPVEDVPAVETVPEPAPADEVIAEADPVDSVVEAAAEDGVAAIAEVEATLAEAESEIIVAEAAPPAEDVIEAADEVVEAEPVADAAAVVEEIVAVMPADTAPAVEAEAAEAAVAEEVEEAEAEAPVAAAMAAPAAYAVDESVLAILREEAEREAQARRAEVAKPLETQTELGIEAAIPESRKPVDAIVPVEAESDDKLANRRTRLPDVEEINSTLRPSEVAESEGAEALPVAAEGRSSFRSGFLLVLTVAILGSAIYGAAESLSQAVPALAGPLKAYVGFVDSLRLHLDGLMQSATVAINGD